MTFQCAESSIKCSKRRLLPSKRRLLLTLSGPASSHLLAACRQSTCSQSEKTSASQCMAETTQQSKSHACTPFSTAARHASSGLQAAPKEVLVARGCLSTPTQRLLGQPPVPLKQAIVVPGTEFPFPEASVQSMQDEVGGSFARSKNYACSYIQQSGNCACHALASHRNKKGLACRRLLERAASFWVKTSLGA